MEERTSGENTNSLSNSRDTSKASPMGPPVAAANATTVSVAPDGAPAAAATSQQLQLSRRRSSSGRQQLPPHYLVKNPITVEHVGGTKHKVVAMNPNPGGRKRVAADNNCVKGEITNGPPDINWYQKTPLGEKVCLGNPQFNWMARKMTRLEALQLMWPPKHPELALQLGKGKECKGWLEQLEKHKQDDA